MAIVPEISTDFSGTMIVSGQIRSILPSFRKNTPIFPGQSFGHPARASGKGVEGCQEWVSGKGIWEGCQVRESGKGPAPKEWEGWRG